MKEKQDMLLSELGTEGQGLQWKTHEAHEVGDTPPRLFLPKGLVLIFLTCYLLSALPASHPFN